MGSIMDRERDWGWEARYYEKQRNCPHTKTERMLYRWYNTCVECGKRVDKKEGDGG